MNLVLFLLVFILLIVYLRYRENFNNPKNEMRQVLNKRFLENINLRF